MTSPDGRARPEDQRAAITLAMEEIADIVASGAQVVLTHGNGPQVGNLLVKNEIAAHVVPPVPLDWCGAQTQGTIGVLIMNALETSLARRGVAASKPAVLVSRTLVDADDPHFAEPSKPIGRYLSEAEAANLIAHGQTWRDQGQRGWRRIVASPEPVECLDAAAAHVLLDAGYTVVCAGGGGVPVVRDGRRSARWRRGRDRQGPDGGAAGPAARRRHDADRDRRGRRDDRLGHARAAAARGGHRRAAARPGRARASSAAAAWDRRSRRPAGSPPAAAGRSSRT